MASGYKKRGIKNKGQQKIKNVKFLLESGTLSDIQAAKQKASDLLKYHWNYYSELARQRSIIQDELKAALIQKSVSYEFKKWQRAVKYKYGLHPLSTIGSLSTIGGRFNTGANVNPEIRSFPGLYIAKNKDTALQEHLGQEATIPSSKLNARELALTNPTSEVIVSVSGNLDKVFDLRDDNNLIPFLKLIRNFSLSKELIKLSRELMEQEPCIVKTKKMLLNTLLDPKWRVMPTCYDVPSNSQIFGHLIYMAGIEGILYPSKFTNIPCLAIFPRNFSATESYIAMDDEIPHPNVPKKIDGTNWRLSEMDAKEVIGY
jgi:hypothetical protein